MAIGAHAGLDDIQTALASSEIRTGNTNSLMPGLPFASVTFVAHGDSRLESAAADQPGREFSVQQASAFAWMPVRVGQKDLALVGPTISVARYHFDGHEAQDAYAAGLVGVWLYQWTPSVQILALGVPMVVSGLGEDASDRAEFYGGAIVRLRQNDRLHWWIGGIYVDDAVDRYVLPYAGFDWLATDRFMVSCVLPWPSVSYALSHDTIFRLGMEPSGGRWFLDADGATTLDIGGWDLGLTWEQHCWRSVWLAVSAGASGFDGLQIQEDGATRWGSEVDSGAYGRISLRFRPVRN